MADDIYDVVIIGTGFGATMTALTLAAKLNNPPKAPRKILMLERGTWWTTPLSTVQDKKVLTYDLLRANGQPVQHWSSIEHLRGLVDLVLRCLRRKKNEDGLYDFTHLGRTGFFGTAIGRHNDGVSVLRACGVGGGSLVYSNITIRPPDFVLDDPRWPLSWTPTERDFYYDLARHAIGYGVVSAWLAAEERNIPYQNKQYADPAKSKPMPPGAINTGLSNIAARTARADPGFARDPQGKTPHISLDPAAEQQNRLWIDRARIFQTKMKDLTNDFGTVDSAINDITPEGSPLNPLEPFNYPPGKTGKSYNFCERQGRCNVGCLPGARHTLNKQLMVAAVGKINPDKPMGDKPDFDGSLFIKALAEVREITPVPEGGYKILYWQRNLDDPHQYVDVTVRARRVVIAAGCMGTNELLLRCKQAHGAAAKLPNLSDRLGHGFSTNGDYIAFLSGLDYPVSLTRGPVTTSFARFNTPEALKQPDQATDPSKFHIIEDQGIPRALAAAAGFGLPLMKRLARGDAHRPTWLTFVILIRWAWHRLLSYIRAFFTDFKKRPFEFFSEDEWVQKMMCIVAQGREASDGQLRLGADSRDTVLRVRRPGNKSFRDDPIFAEIRQTLSQFAVKLGSNQQFQDPFDQGKATLTGGPAIATSHPLGGCAMGRSAADGVVDEFGRVFDKSTPGGNGFYPGLYVVDASIMPTALGVNPSLTISALALRIAEHIEKGISAEDHSTPAPLPVA